MTPTIAIGCPVRNRAWILPDYLAALQAIEHPAKQYLFLENDSTDETWRTIWDWLYALPSPRTVSWQVDEHHSERRQDGLLVSKRSDEAPGHRRGEYGANAYAHLAAVRNRFIDLFLSETTAQFLISVDSDVIVPPNILEQLLQLADDNTIVAAAISNIPDRPLDGYTCGNFLVNRGGLLLHPTGDQLEKRPGYPLSGVLEVDVTGACVLLPRALLERGVRYAAHPQGEDFPFCEQAKALGARIIVTFDVRPEHRMTETLP